jgi:hypothetical protein
LPGRREAIVVTALGDLVVANLRGRTFVQLALDSAERISAVRWQRLTYRPVPDEPPDETVSAIAETLGLPERTVVAAIYRDVYGCDPIGARRRIARGRAIAQYSREFAVLARARQLGLGARPWLDPTVLEQVVAWAELSPAEVEMLIGRALAVEERLRDQGLDDAC